MRILSSRSVNNARFLRTLVAAVIASIMCCDLGFTGGKANNSAIVRREPEKEQIKKVDGRLIAGASKILIQALRAGAEKTGEHECFYFAGERHACFGNDI
jgi:hypothetical protein